MSGGSPKGKPKNRLNAVLYATLLAELIEGPTTRQEMADHTGLSRQTILSLVRALHERGLIHIASWEKDARGKHSIAAFRFGSGRDAKRPPPLQSNEVTRAWRQRRMGAGTIVAGIGVAR